MKFKKICSIALAVSILGTSSAVFSVNAEVRSSGTFGDVNHDNFINAYDITKLQDYVLEPESVNNEVLCVGDINHDGKIDNNDVSDFVDAFIYADSHRGDVNGDSKINILDVTEIQKYLAKLTELTLEQKTVADTNNDEKINILDVTQIQKHLAKYNTSKTDFPTASVKATDKECRKKYADYIKKYNIDDMLKGYYVVGQNSSSWLIFRDDKWEYFYNYYDNTVGLCDYLGNNKTEILPVKLTTGKAIVEIGPYSSFSPFSCGIYTNKDDAPYSNLENIFIPSNYKLMRNSFEGNKKIKNVFFASDNGIAHEWSVFEGCSSLERVVLPSSMFKIPSSMFEDCKSLKKVLIPDGTVIIERSAFSNTAISKIIIPKSVKTIDQYSFASQALKDVYVMNPTADIHLNWASVKGKDWSSLTVYGYKNSTLYDWWKISEEEDLNVKMVFLD